MAPDETLPGSHHWRALRYFSYYRLALALVLLVTLHWGPHDKVIGYEAPDLAHWATASYLLAGIACLLLLDRWRQAFDVQLTLQVGTDILFLSLLLHASGGGQSPLLMLLLIVVSAAGLVGQGRMVLFHAALASLFLLLEHAYRVLEGRGEAEDFFRAGITSAGFFVTAIAARLLASRIMLNEHLARRRGIELADQVRINERVIRDMRDGVLVVDAKGRIQQANPQAAVLMGSKDPLPALLSESFPAAAQEYQTWGGRGIESEAVLRVPATGATLRVRFMPPGEGGNAVLFLQDMGRLEQQAQQMKLAALGRLTANMAHEIRNPLAAISHAAELLGDGTDNAGTQRLIAIIGENTQRLNRLVGEILELGRRDRAAPETVWIGPFVSQIIEECSLGDPSAAVRIRMDIPPSATVCFDRGHLHRVLSNLLDNALHHASAAPGAVSITAQADTLAGRVDVHVSDDGSGIGAKLQGQIFEPFVSGRTGGTGLGLYIARELSDANGARLSLRENAPGAHFCLSCLSTCPELKPARPEN